MQPHIDLVRGFDELVRKAGAAAGAEDYPGFPECAIDVLVPPTSVPEFHGVAPRRVELAHDRIQAGFGVAEARRQLEKEASHSVAEDIGDYPEIPDEGFGTLEPFDMRNELANLDRVNEIVVSRLAAPRLHAGYRRP
jgi:hypothetical protein